DYSCSSYAGSKTYIF
nr:immunoglobulin light chain junction region [Macaca mulatta]MOW14940.1 immunoglobulin light chain junction region [Macaca mulatta]MOW15085.1 immunoglobulin light chain junction region [Macaca mulatta]MOW15536.1 immunoglobulin light chain junction region [Macaca mulatta]MOW15909.1 immunoglobulin light chain junction region [Macaca mulatta]